jgi:hypothetical protein
MERPHQGTGADPHPCCTGRSTSSCHYPSPGEGPPQRRRGRGMDSPTLLIQRKSPARPSLRERESLREKEKKWAWKKILPKEGEPVTEVVDGTSYHLECEHHPKQWVCHTSDECSKNPKNNGVPRYSSNSTDNTKKKLKATCIAAAASLLNREMTCQMVILMVTEEEARKGCSLHSSLLSVGHSFTSCKLLPPGFCPSSCAWSLPR